jgi:excisionase family DNA binding protein
LNLLTVRQAAMRACVSESLVYAWCQSGQLPHLRLGGNGKRGCIRITAEDFDGFLAACRVEGYASEDGEPLKHIR